jgi:PAS domain S-box-containing protein
MPLTRHITAVIVLAALYLGLGMLGLQAAFQQGWASAVFPASGLALASFLLLGYRAWAGIWLGALVLNLWPAYASAQALSSASILMSCAMSVGATLEALAGAYLLRRFVGSLSPFDGAQDVIKFVFIVTLSCTVSATIGVLALCLNGITTWADFDHSWFTWWTGDILGMLVVTPLLITWSQPTRFTFNASRLPEAVLLTVLLTATAQSIFGGWSALSTSGYPISFLVTPFLMWAAFRFGPRGAATASVLTSSITIWGTMRGIGPFAQQSYADASLNLSLLLLQSYMAFTSLMVLVLAAVTSERQRAEAEVQSLITELEQRVAERTTQLEETNQQLSKEIVERKQAEELLREREERFRRIFEEGPLGIAVVGLDNSIRHANAQLCRMLGYPEEELKSRKAAEITHPDDIGAHDHLRQQLFAGEISSYQVERRYLTKGGQVLSGSLTAALIRDQEGHPLYALAIIEDITQRKQAEQAVRESEERFQFMAATSGDALYQLRYDSLAYDYISPAIATLTGYSPEEINTIGLRHLIERVEGTITYSEFPDEETRQRVREHGEYSADYLVRTKEGDLKWLGDHSFPWWDDNGEVIGSVGSLSDITQRKHNEEALRISVERFQILSRATNDAVWDWNFLTDEVWWNESFEALFGYSRESIEPGADSWKRRIHPDDLERVSNGIHAVIESGQQSWSDEYRFRRADDSYADIFDRGFLIHDGNGRPIRMVGSMQDITQRKEWEAKLKAREMQLAEAQRIAHIGSWEWDISTNEVCWSDELYRIFGWQPQEFKVTPMNSQEQVHADDRELVERLVSQCLREHQPVNIHHRILRRDGAERIIHARARVVVGVDGNPVRMFGTTQDATELQQAQQELQQLNNQLEEHVVQRTRQYVEAKEEAERANEAKSVFLSRMSHELRTPLNAILGFGQVLQSEDLDEYQHDSVNHILKGGEHLLNLINEVLDIARVESGHMDLSLEPVLVWEVVKEAVDLINPLAGTKGIQIDNTISPEGETHVQADRQRFKQVLINLLSNAVKYNRPGGYIHIFCQQVPAGQLRISVRDSGRGIAPQDLPQLFKPFERLGAKHTNIEGTGLGLTLSKRLIEAMQGHMGVESTLGEGSLFFVELTLAQSPLEQIVTQQGMESIQKQENTTSIIKHLLLIEDNLSNLRLIEMIIQRRPHIRLLAAMQGSIGLDMARQHQPDLILLDLHLPDITGHEVLRHLKESPETKDIPVVICSADATPTQVERLLVQGACAYLTKPINVKQFLQTLDETLRSDEM